MMSVDDFRDGFEKLIQAFTVGKPDEKAKIYYERLKKIPFDAWQKTCDNAVDTCDKFPTIAKLVSISQNFQGYTGRTEQPCNDCDGFGTISMWNHTFRGRCIHGEKVSKYIPLAPRDEFEKERAYQVLNKSWKELYGQDLPRNY